MTKSGPASTVLEKLGEVVQRWNLDELEEDIEELTDGHSIQVGFLGDSGTGKSTLINELTGMEDLMPTRLEPCTANACQVVSTPDIEAPEYFHLEPSGEMRSIKKPAFDDLACGRVAGRPRVHLPSCAGFSAGFIFLDTPGLSTFIEEHTEVTLGELPFLDAAVVCVDIRKGGLTRTVTEFLKFPGIRHLQHRSLIALTFADQLQITQRQEVAGKVAGTLSHTVDCPESEAAGRTVVVSAGPEAAERDVSALRTAIQEVFENRWEALMAERQCRGAGRLVPRAIDLLNQVRESLQEPDEAFESRRTEAKERSARVEEELKRQRQRLENSLDELRRDVLDTCLGFCPRFAAAADDQTREEVSRAFHICLKQIIDNHVTEFGKDSGPPSDGQDAGIQQILKRIDQVTDLAATIATAAATAAIMPYAGPAATAGEAAVGGTVRQVAASSARKAGRAGHSAFRTGMGRVLRAIHNENPINQASVLFAEWLKGKMIAEPLEDLAKGISTRVSTEIKTYFESEVFRPLEREREEVGKMLNQVEADRRKDLEHRTLQVSRVDQDIEDLQKAAVCHGRNPQT